jgi:hypothetical protein
MFETQTRNEDAGVAVMTRIPASEEPVTDPMTATPEFEDLGEEYLAEAVVRLIRHNRRVRQAILDFAMSSSNIKTEI